MTYAALREPTWAKGFLDVARKEAKYSNEKAARIATTHFHNWILQGSGRGLKRQHMMSRASDGWVDSANTDADAGDSGTDSGTAAESRTDTNEDACSDKVQIQIQLHI